MTSQRARKLPTGPLFIAAQFMPMAVLALSYHYSSDRIEQWYLGGVRLDRLLLTSAVIAPILSQSVSGPLFRSLEIEPHRSFAQTATLTLRNLPRAMVVAAPVLVAIAVLTASALGMQYRGTLALVGIVWVHVLFAAALVPAYAHRLGALLVLGWSVYAGVLAAAPHLWWAPSVVAFVSQVGVLLAVCQTRLPLVPVASYRAMLSGMLRGIALALPLWCLPVTVYLASSGTMSPVAIFLSLTPALLAYQAYFVIVATPVWTRIDGARTLLAHEAYPRARRELSYIDELVRNGLARVTALLSALVALGSYVVYASGPEHARLLCGLMLSAGLSVVVIAEVTRLTMVREGRFLYLVSGAVTAPLLLGAVGGLPLGTLLVLHGSTCALAWLSVRVANRAVWRTPEYSMFWATALQH